MSYLSSVLNSISKGDSSTSSPAPRQQNTGRPPTVTTSGSGLKRKADIDLQRSENKSQKTGDQKVARDIKPVPERFLQTGGAGSLSRSSNQSKPGNTSSSNGTRPDRVPSNSSLSRPPSQQPKAPTSVRPNTASITSSKTVPASGSKQAGSASKQGKVETPSTTNKVSTQSQPQPKKGSFKDLMARAKAAQTIAVGKITHKAAEKLTKKDRQALAKGKPVRGKDLPAPAPPSQGPKGTVSKGGQTQKTATPAAASKYQGTSKPKGPAKSGYQGTSKPVTKPSFKGTSRDKAPPQAQKASKPQPKADRNEYLGTDEEDEGEYGYDSEEQYYEDSEDYSDMDAGFDEIGEEEEEAERQAKRDDVKEQKLLDKLAREKAERRKGR